LSNLSYAGSTVTAKKEDEKSKEGNDNATVASIEDRMDVTALMNRLASSREVTSYFEIKEKPKKTKKAAEQKPKKVKKKAEVPAKAPKKEPEVAAREAVIEKKDIPVLDELYHVKMQLENQEATTHKDPSNEIYTDSRKYAISMTGIIVAILAFVWMLYEIDKKAAQWIAQDETARETVLPKKDFSVKAPTPGFISPNNPSRETPRVRRTVETTKISPPARVERKAAEAAITPSGRRVNDDDLLLNILRTE